MKEISKTRQERCTKSHDKTQMNQKYTGMQAASEQKSPSAEHNRNNSETSCPKI
jgi:hypothetical protein